MAASTHSSNGNNSSANKDKRLPASSHAIKGGNSERLQSRVPSATKMSNNSKQMTPKRKRQSPFRIKVGCIAALRYRSTGNHIRSVTQSGEVQNLSTTKSDSSYVEVWTDPLPGRDEGFALIGRRVRCCFPKSILSSSEKNNSTVSSSKKTTSRIVEGEIVSLVDYEKQWRFQRKRRRRRDPCGTLVELLVDKEVLTTMPFLQQIDKSHDDSLAKSSKEMQRLKFEEIIKGKNKVTVQAMLADPSRITKSSGVSSNSDDDLVARWVIRKRVAMPLIKKRDSSEKGSDAGNGCSSVEKPPKRRKTENKKRQQEGASTTRYVGDGNDSAAQQERNWRWLAGRYHDLQRRSGTSNDKLNSSLDDVTTGFVGEVLKVSRNEQSSSSLATVSIRRLILPENTKKGRMSHHDPNEMFDDSDSYNKLVFQVPVEELVIVCRKVERKLDAPSNFTNNIHIQHGEDYPVIIQSYSRQKEVFMPLLSGKKKNSSENGSKDSKNVSPNSRSLVCSNCQRPINTGEVSSTKGDQLGREELSNRDSKTQPWCEECLLPLQKVDDSDKWKDEDEESKKATHLTVLNMKPTYFDLPVNYLRIPALPEPSEMPVSLVKKRIWKKKNMKKAKKVKKEKKSDPERKIKKKLKLNTGRKSSKVLPRTPVRRGQAQTDQTSEEEEDYNVFQPTCCRTLAYDVKKKEYNGVSKQKFACRRASLQGRSVQRRDAVRSSGRQIDSSRIEKVDGIEKKTTSRAARANQRRMMKGVAAFGATSLGLDALAGREQQLRFDKSLIHAWGVFADEAINGGEMIVEYRGELIGNAVAEKREKEYEVAKIGSDYMFRIDSDIVCDATKQGNVARFINASCNPNCYTQIITLNGVKRITIYAKRDIKAGEELCYDYKFPLEYDETKRIKCYCGAQGCRGYMNWDKRYGATKPLGEKSPPQRKSIALKQT